jgi:hypothetical protein
MKNEWPWQKLPSRAGVGLCTEWQSYLPSICEALGLVPLLKKEKKIKSTWEIKDFLPWLLPLMVWETTEG